MRWRRAGVGVAGERTRDALAWWYGCTVVFGALHPYRAELLAS
jgi:hypothetical protein